MPLKHSTETVLVFFLGLLIVLSGVALAIMPSLTVSVWPWLIGFAVTIVYPLLVYPLLKRKRADYLFRALHLFPAVMFLAWLLLDFLRSSLPITRFVHTMFTWGLSLPAVVLGVLLLMLFSLLVVRQRIRRVLLLLLLLLVPLGFTALHNTGRMPSSVHHTVASVLQYLPESMVEKAFGPDYSPSDNKYEHAWRMQLRRRKRRQERLADNTAASDSASSLEDIAARHEEQSQPLIAANTSDSAAGDMKKDDMAAHGGTTSQQNDAMKKSNTTGTRKDRNGMSDTKDAMNADSNGRTTVDAPPNLAHTGFGIEFIAISLVALYCGVLHQRSRRRFVG